MRVAAQTFSSSSKGEVFRAVLRLVLPIVLVFGGLYVTAGFNPLNFVLNAAGLIFKPSIAGIPSIPSKNFPLQPIQDVRVSDSEGFVPSDHFIVNNQAIGSPSILNIDEAFREHFLTADAPKAPNGGTLHIYRVSFDDAYDVGLIQNLGARYETYVSDVWALIKRQNVSKFCLAGGVLSRESANLFFLKDASGDPWTVTVHCGWYYSYGGLSITATPANGHVASYVGAYVISRGP